MGIVGYSDSSHKIIEDDDKSTIRHIFYMNESPITWCSKKQETIALSLCEAEYMAVCATCCQAIWICDLVAEITGEKM